MCAVGGLARSASVTPAYSVATRVLKYRPVWSCSRSATCWAPADTRSISPEGTKAQTMGFSSEPRAFFWAKARPAASSSTRSTRVSLLNMAILLLAILNSSIEQAPEARQAKRAGHAGTRGVLGLEMRAQAQLPGKPAFVQEIGPVEDEVEAQGIQPDPQPGGAVHGIELQLAAHLVIDARVEVGHRHRGGQLEEGQAREGQAYVDVVDQLHVAVVAVGVDPAQGAAQGPPGVGADGNLLQGPDRAQGGDGHLIAEDAVEQHAVGQVDADPRRVQHGLVAGQAQGKAPEIARSKHVVAKPVRGELGGAHGIDAQGGQR